MIRLYLEGDVEGARELNAGSHRRGLVPVERRGTEPAADQGRAAECMGLPAGECRLPMGNAPDWLEPKARSMLANLDLWRSSRPARARVTSPDA